MAQTSAERQAAYRDRQKLKEATRINVMVSPLAKSCLERLVRHRFKTQRDCLEDLLIEAERVLTEALADESAYYAVTR